MLFHCSPISHQTSYLLDTAFKLFLKYADYLSSYREFLILNDYCLQKSPGNKKNITSPRRSGTPRRLKRSLNNVSTLPQSLRERTSTRNPKPLDHSLVSLLFPKNNLKMPCMSLLQKENKLSNDLILSHPFDLILQEGSFIKGKGHVRVNIILLLVKATAFAGQSAEPPWPTWPPSPSATGNAPTALSRDSSSHRPGHWWGMRVCYTSTQMNVCTRLFQPMSPFPYPSLHLHTVYFRYHFPVVKSRYSFIKIL